MSKWIIRITFPSGSQWAASSKKTDNGTLCFALVPIQESGVVRHVNSWTTQSEAYEYWKEMLALNPSMKKLKNVEFVLAEVPQ